MRTDGEVKREKEGEEWGEGARKEQVEKRKKRERKENEEQSGRRGRGGGIHANTRKRKIRNAEDPKIHTK